MRQNKKGLSEAVMTVIMIALVLVAVGVIWVVVQNILAKSATNIDYNQRCLGITIEPTSFDVATNTVTVERTTGSTGDPINGFEVTLSSATASGAPQPFSGDVAVSRTIIVDQADSIIADANKVSVRLYFDDTKDVTVKHYCNNIFVYPKA